MAILLIDALFWIASASAGPVWLSSVLFPKADLTKRVWHSPWLSLPWALGFAILVLPRLAWWLGLFVNPSLSAQHLTEQFSTADNFILLWYYILGFDIIVFQVIYKDCIQRDALAFEITIWALVTALCAPVGWLGYTLLRELAQPTEKQD
eukprot:m.43239 g.43239  ORF g.43239 m.43239 type:complete len:150 (-) comp12912_c0_seq2:1014-1463(-)